MKGASRPKPPCRSLGTAHTSSGHWAAAVFLSLALLWGTAPAFCAENSYIGSKACAECHEKEYQNFERYAKKAHSFQAIKKMRAGLSADEIKTCYRCHTTGYGEPGGFVSEQATPEMANSGCEICHGPGALHAESGDVKDIISRDRMTFHICEKCHTEEIVKEFNFKPLLHGGAH